MTQDENELAPGPNEIKSFVVGLTSQGWRAFDLEGDRIPGCFGKSFDEVCEMVYRYHPGAMLYAVRWPVPREGWQ